MMKGISEKDIKDFTKYANKLSEVCKRFNGKGYVSLDMGALTLYSKDDEAVTTVYMDNMHTGYN